MSDNTGSRNTMLYALAKELRRRNLTNTGIRKRVLAANRHFVEPLSEQEIETTIFSQLFPTQRSAA